MGFVRGATEWDNAHEIAGPGHPEHPDAGSDYNYDAESERKRVQYKGLLHL